MKEKGENTVTLSELIKREKEMQKESRRVRIALCPSFLYS